MNLLLPIYLYCTFLFNWWQLLLIALLAFIERNIFGVGLSSVFQNIFFPITTNNNHIFIANKMVQAGIGVRIFLHRV